MNGIDLLHDAYEPLIEFASTVDESTGWTPTELPGWAVRDLIYHLATDAQRALLALARPTRDVFDLDEVSYWANWQPGTPTADAALRGVRISASAWTSVRGPADLFAGTASAVLAQAERVDADDCVSTQGHVLTVEALLRTLTVEAVVHHLDFGATIANKPTKSGLGEVRHVLDGLLGESGPAQWGDVTYARLGTGRDQLSSEQRSSLGRLARRFPLFG